MKKYMNQYSDKNLFISNAMKFLVFILFMPCIVFGQVRLSVEDAVREGLIKNYSIRIAKNESDISLRNVTYGNAGFLPSVTAYGSIDKAYLNAKVEVVSGAELESKNAQATITSAGIKAEWTLFDGTGMFADYERLKTLWRISDIETKVEMEKVVYEVILSYCNVIRNEELLQACNQRMKSSNMRFQIARDKKDSGMGSELESIQAEVALQADSVAVLKQTAELEKSRIHLNLLLTADVNREFTPDDSISLALIPDLNSLISSGLNFNNLIRLNTEQLILSKTGLKSLKSEQYPKLNLTGSYGYYENDTEAAFIKYNRYFGPQFGLNIGMKLFDGLKLNRSIQNAKIEVENRELQVKEIEKRIIAIITSTHLDYTNQLKTIDLSKRSLSLAKKNLDIALKAFQAGLISSLQLREAQDDLFNASSGLVNAYYYAKVKETEMLSISGILIK